MLSKALVLLIVLGYAVTSDCSWSDWVSDIIMDSPQRHVTSQKEMGKSNSIFKPDIHQILDTIDSITPTNLEIGEHVQLEIPPFAYEFFQIKLPTSLLGTNETAYLLFQSTCFSGEYTLYVLRTGNPSYYKHQEYALSGQGGVALLTQFTSDDNILYLSVEGNRKSIWSQYEFIHAPRSSALSLTVWEMRFVEGFEQLIVELKNGKPEFTQVTTSLPTYLQYNSTATGDDFAFLLVTCELGTSLVYISQHNPYPSAEDNEYSFQVEGSTSAPYVGAELHGSGIFYIGIETQGQQSNQAVLVHEGNTDVEIIEGPFYKLNIPATSAYQWMKLSFEAYQGLSLFVKNGGKPTRLEYDWVWRYPVNESSSNTVSFEHWYIPANDENFNAGYFYFWFYWSGSHVPSYDYLRVSLSTWNPLYI